LVVEDLHWADQSTRDLLAFLVRNLRRERLLVVVTYRSDEPGQRRLGPYLAELDRGGSVERLLLARLDRAETAAQLTGILGAVPAVDLVDGVFDRSEGNPFFTEELLESARAGSSTLPTTLRDLLQGRIEALPEPARQVLRVAAVAGRQVPHPLLAAVAVLDEGQLDGVLREVVAYQLLVPREDGYQFRHALLREVVDAGLLPGERTRLHAAYAHALAEWPELSAGSPAVVAELAVHWDAAGESAMKFSRAEGVTINAFASARRLRSASRWRRTSRSTLKYSSRHLPPCLDQPLVGVAVATLPQPVVQHHVVTRLDEVDQAAGKFLDHWPFAIEVLRNGIVHAVAAVPRVDLLVHRQANGAAGLEPPGAGGLPRAGQTTKQVHDGRQVAMLSRRTP
jgi:hypothetical protein